MDSPPCSSSSECYALTTPVALHSTSGLLTKVSGAWEKADGTFLAQHINLNNQFVPSVNIALNSIGFSEVCGNYYSDITANLFSWGSSPGYFYLRGYDGEYSIKWASSNLPASSSSHTITSGYCYINTNIIGTSYTSGGSTAYWYYIKRATISN